MKLLKNLAVWVLILQLSGLGPLLAQPVIIQPNNPFGGPPTIGSGIENLRVMKQSQDGTEAQITMDFSYDGMGGPVAKIVPIIGKRGQKGVSAWFGSDPVTIGRGRGTITVRVRYFNDEPGVPPMFTSDELRIYILNQQGTALVGPPIPFLKTIRWGSLDARPVAEPAAPTLAMVNTDATRKLAQEKQLAEEKARAEAEARVKAREKAELEAKARKEAEEKARAEALAREESRKKAEAEAVRIAAESKAAEEKRLTEERQRSEEEARAEAERKRLAEEKRLAEAKTKAEALAREEARKKAEAEELVRKEAEAKALAEAKAREEARLLAEAEAKRLAEERRVAEEKARAEALAREDARKKAEAEAARLAEEKRLADQRAQKEAEQKEQIRLAVEAKARDEARLRAEAEAKRLAKEKRLAEARRMADEKAREEARLKAEAETKRLAEERRIAEEKARAEALVREGARKKAEADERVRKDAEAKAFAEAQAREEARKRAEAEAIRKEQERRLAEARRIAEEKAREEARLKAEGEAKRLAEEKRFAEEKAIAEANARKAAEDKARDEALAQARAEQEAKRFAEEKTKAQALVQSAVAPVTAPSVPGPSLEIAQNMRTKITNVDVVNRSLDRSQMTFGVEFEYNDKISGPMLGVDVLRQNEPSAVQYFASSPAEIGKSRRNFVLFPVHFRPPAGFSESSGFSTDKVLVYLLEKASAKRYNIFPATMLLMWRAPGSRAVISQQTGNSVEIEDFKQNDASSGYISVKYNLLGGKARLRARVLDSKNPRVETYFSSATPEVQAGRGFMLVDVRVEPNAKTPTDIFAATAVEVELLDGDKVVARVRKESGMTWARPK